MCIRDRTTIALDLRQPTVQQLQGLAPGGIDASVSSKPSVHAPLLCGGTSGGRLTAASVVKVPNTLSDISVVRYEFPSSSAANGFFDALRSKSSTIQNATCTGVNADSGHFLVVSLISFPGSPRADASGTTTFAGGVFSGAYRYNVLRYVRQDRVVYLIRVDQQHDYPDISILDGIENAMNVRAGAELPRGAHSAKPTEVRGVLTRGQWECCSFGQPPIGPIGFWAQSEDVTCPQVVVTGTPYTIVFENQVPNVQPDGLVALTGDGVRSTTIPWGAHVSVVVDLFDQAGAFGCRVGNKISAAVYMKSLSIKVVQ